MPTARTRITALALTCAFACGAAAHTPAPGRTATHRPAPARTSTAHPLVASSTLASRLLDAAGMTAELEALVDDIGGRPTGTPALTRAVRQTALRFRAAGYPDVREEPYRIARAFAPSVETAEISNAAYESSEQNRRLRVAQLPMTPPTIEDGLDAEVVDLGRGDAAAFARAGARIKRRWVLVHPRAVRTRLERISADAAQLPLFLRAHRGGAAGVLEIADRADRVLRRAPVRFDETLAPLPGALVEREGGERVARLLGRGFNVRIRAVLLGRTLDDVRASNVVAELRGGTLPLEEIVLAAHLDSWDLGRGALDDGANVVLLETVAAEMARFARAGTRPRRSIRFVITTGAHAGMLGAAADLAAHRTLDDVRAYVALDEAAGPLDGFSTLGRTDLGAMLAAALVPVRGLGAIARSDAPLAESDALDALLAGIPALVATHAGEPGDVLGGESDTFERVDPAALHRDAAIVGALAWNLADSAELPRRQTRAQVEHVLAAGGVGAQLRALGLRAAFAPQPRAR